MKPNYWIQRQFLISLHICNKHTTFLPKKNIIMLVGLFPILGKYGRLNAPTAQPNSKKMEIRVAPQKMFAATWKNEYP